MDAHIGSVDRPSPAAVNGAVGCPASAPGCPIMSSHPAPLAAGAASLGRHWRAASCRWASATSSPSPGNSTSRCSIDHLVAEPGLRLVGCCNEVNAGRVR
ncbi:hypothetical protein QYE76_025717 [Lolium multiflorum]|uniref:Uncharacterized protein n=1 Tax=Lolium multiflorum TaxID=4521 RepID=A0AAD8RG41_LOLMU|nr:hypothetical protein QYE76_025717 [Lolium multiflorum]